jgi:hypothetical protein
MAKLIIKRTSDWTNIMRDLGIYLDGKKIGVIGNGELKEFDIEQGEHTLKSKIDWCGSETLNITVTDNENKKIELSGFKLGKFILPIILIISVIYFVFRERLNLDPMLFLLLILPIGLYLIYHLTLGRNKYLRFEEK